MKLRAVTEFISTLGRRVKPRRVFRCRTCRRLVAVGMLLGPVANAQERTAPTLPITGVVYDSIANAPLAGALVQLLSLGDRTWARSAVAEADGRFRFDSVPAGGYVLGFLHPRLDSLLITPPLREVRVPDVEAGVTLAVPSVGTIARAVCPEAPLAADEALFIGHVRSARDATPAAFGVVHVQWSETIIDGSVRQRRPAITAEADAAGAFVVCGVPVGTPALVQGVSDDGASGVIELQAPATRLLLRDLRTAPIERVETVADAAADETRDASLPPDTVTRVRGAGQLRGRVLTEDGAPIAGVRVQVRETLLEAVTDAEGVFALQHLPLGTHAIEARAIGYAPLRQATDIAGSDTAPLVLTMQPVDATLDAVRVFGERRTPYWKREFDERRRQGLGRFVDEAAIARRNPMMVSDLLAGLPGVTIRAGLFTRQSQLLLRSSGGGDCVPDIVVDGMLVNVSDIGVDAFVMASRLVGVELYRSQILRPTEFPMQRGCGLIVLWTGDRQEPPA
jgi:hypothetical protein